MRISYRRKSDGAYLFQHITTKEMVFLPGRKKEFVLLSLNEREYSPQKSALAALLIAEMLEHGNFPDKPEDIEIVETATIEFQSLAPQPSHRRGP